MIASAEISSWVDRLASFQADSDAERIALMREIERLKSACAAAQATLTAAFVESQTAGKTLSAQRAAKLRRSMIGEIALARRESPTAGARSLGLALTLYREMPNTLAALRRGETNEWRATLVARETAVLSREHRQQTDLELAGRLGSLGDRQVAAETARIAYRLDPHAVVRRNELETKDRRVTLRPAPGLMTRLSAVLPLADGVALFAALDRHARSATANGDSRSRGQLMADELVQRTINSAASTVTPTVSSSDGKRLVPAGVGIDIQLQITDHTLFGGDDEPALVPRFGPIPAPLARQLVRDADRRTRVWVRRLYQRPETGDLIAMDTKRRLFARPLRQFLVYRDQWCRTPWCAAPIRQADHIRSFADGGPTNMDNAQGLCETCNHTKEAAGWSAHVVDSTTVITSTPNGGCYSSPVPRPLRCKPWADFSFVETRLNAVLLSTA